MENRRIRLRAVLDWLKSKKIFKSYKSIADSMGYNPSVLSQVVNGKINVSSSIVSALCSIYPGINYDWIWEGKGEMIYKSINSESIQIMPDSSLNRYTFVLMEVVSTMRSIALLVEPMNKEINLLKNQIENQNKIISNLQSQINKLKSRH